MSESTKDTPQNDIVSEAETEPVSEPTEEDNNEAEGTQDSELDVEPSEDSSDETLSEQIVEPSEKALGEQDAEVSDDEDSAQDAQALSESETAPDKMQSAEQTEPAQTNKVRERTAIGLVIACAVLLALAVPALWVNNLVTNTDAWVSTVAPLSSNPDAQEELATRTAEAIKQRIGAVALAEEVLPEELKVLAIPFGAAVNSYIDEATHEFVSSVEFFDLWTEMNTQIHSAFTTLFVEDNSDGILALNEGELSLDITLVIDAVYDKLEAEGINLDAFDGTIRDKLSGERIVLLNSPGLAGIESAVSFLAALAFGLLILGLCALVGALAVSYDKRKTGLLICLACFASFLLIYLIFALAQYPLASALVPVGGSLYKVITAVYSTLFSSLFTIQIVCLIIFALAALILFLLGPSELAATIKATSAKLAQWIKTSFSQRVLKPVEDIINTPENQ